MSRFNFKLLKRFWAIAKLYWVSNEQGSLGLVVLLGVLLFATTQLKVLLNYTQGELISALSAHDSNRFWQGVIFAFGGIIIFGFLNSGYGYLRERIGIYWRQWLTYHFLNQYFRNRAFYELTNLQQEIDNPDQRISEDIGSFTQQFVQFFANIIEAIFVVIAFSITLWNISINLVIALLVYTILAYAITIGFYGKKLTELNFNQLKKEANFRFGLVRIRENAESIAFYNGIEQEANKVKFLFNDIFNNLKRLILWSEVYLNIFKYQFGYLPWIIPALILGPDILVGEIELGKITEAGGAFGQVAFSVNLIMYQFEKFTKFAASINRLYIFYQYLKQPIKQIANAQNIEIVKDSYIGIKSLTLYTPDRQKKLFENISVDLPPGQGLLIMGESGCGKTSLLRAIAGLWNSGTGTIVRPEVEEILFLPQRPYMILGTLREQLFYPNAKVALSDEELNQILHKVNLSDLAEQFGGFDVEKDWREVLSLGEQQRLAFARLLVTKPKYAILDEATSALDENNEEKLYNLMLKTGATFVSIGHRSTLKKYHQIVVVLSSTVSS